MLRKHTTRLAGELISQIDFENGPEPRDRTTHVVRDAVIGAAGLFIPDDATGAVATRDGADGILIATDDHGLYSIEGILPETDMEPGTARCQLTNIDRNRDTVKLETLWQRPFPGTEVRDSVWQFRVGDLAFQITTRDDSDMDTPADERFAQRLAAALGWNFGGDARELKAAA